MGVEEGFLLRFQKCEELVSAGVEGLCLFQLHNFLMECIALLEHLVVLFLNG